MKLIRFFGTMISRVAVATLSVGVFLLAFLTAMVAVTWPLGWLAIKLGVPPGSSDNRFPEADLGLGIMTLIGLAFLIGTYALEIAKAVISWVREIWRKS